MAEAKQIGRCVTCSLAIVDENNVGVRQAFDVAIDKGLTIASCGNVVTSGETFPQDAGHTLSWAARIVKEAYPPDGTPVHGTMTVRLLDLERYL